MITGLSHIAFRVSDLDRALAFYSGLLGFPEMFRLYGDDGALWLVYLRVSETTYLELFPGGDPRPEVGRRALGYNHFCLAVDDLRQTLADLAARGLALEGEPRLGRDGNWQYWITDPDGNRIELMEIAPDSLQRQALARLAAARGGEAHAPADH